MGQQTDPAFDKVVPYAQGPETWVEADVDAPADRVWDLASDPAVAARFSPELQEVEWLDGAEGPAAGARFLGRNKAGGFGWETTCTITALDAGRRLAYAVNDVDDPVAVWTWEVEPIGDGRARLRHHVRMGPGRSGVTWAIRQRPDEELKIIADRLANLRAAMQRTVDGIADLAKQG